MAANKKTVAKKAAPKKAPVAKKVVMPVSPAASLAETEAKTAEARQEVRDGVTAGQLSGKDETIALMERMAAKKDRDDQAHRDTDTQRNNAKAAAIQLRQEEERKAHEASKMRNVKAEAEIAGIQVERKAVLEVREENRAGVSSYTLNAAQQPTEDKCNATLQKLNTKIASIKALL